LALEFACPAVLGVQARREVDDTKTKIPGLSDAQWTSGVEQVSDVVISLMRPAKYFEQGQRVGSITVEGHHQMLVTVVKQKLGTDNNSAWVFFDPATNRLAPLAGLYELNGYNHD
jgi:replicative DNA helicase